ncbi:major facilitator superfamily domain-containing protein [Aspergillus karnatakaensis]|uniref:major facilitator superfamily domain-containing protein n=1 Tax=Aspergillus karnatakaensis TaxID=1810916 RepID=UPI003CCE2D54
MAAQADETTPLNPGQTDVSYSAITALPAKHPSSSSHVLPDEESDAVPESPVEPPVKALTSVGSIIAVLLLGEFISNADSTLIMTATARITSEFNQLQGAAWLSTGYTLGVCVFQPMYGKLSDIYGRKALLLVSYFFLAFGCVVCGLAPEMWIVILGRALSGIGGAGVMTMSAIIITDIVSKREVAQWRAYINVAMTLGRSIGGPVGGVLTDTIGWRWAFLLQAPLLGLAALLVTVQLKLAPREPTEGGDRPGIRRIDFRGAFLLATSIGSLILLLDQGGKLFPWSSAPALLLAGSGALALVLFIYTELYVAPEPIFDLHILARPNITPSYLISALQVAAQVGMMFTVPLYFQVTARASSSLAGAHLIPAVLGNTVGGLSAGLFIRKTGNYKPVLVIAGLVSSISYILQFLRWNGHTGVAESFYIVFGGMGSGFSGSSAFVSMTAYLEPHEIAMATSGYSLLISFAITAGVTLNYTLLGSEFKRQMERQLHGPDASKIIRRALSSIAYISSLTGSVHEIVVGCYVAGLKHAYLFSLVCALLGAAVALSVRNHRL